MGENTILIYDILQFNEEHNILGVMLQVDFNKAFDLISWNFIYKYYLSIKLFQFWHISLQNLRPKHCQVKDLS